MYVMGKKIMRSENKETKNNLLNISIIKIGFLVPTKKKNTFVITTELRTSAISLCVPNKEVYLNI